MVSWQDFNTFSSHCDAHLIFLYCMLPNYPSERLYQFIFPPIDYQCLSPIIIIFSPHYYYYCLMLFFFILANLPSKKNCSDWLSFHCWWDYHFMCFQAICIYFVNCFSVYSVYISVGVFNYFNYEVLKSFDTLNIYLL